MLKREMKCYIGTTPEYCNVIPIAFTVILVLQRYKVMHKICKYVDLYNWGMLFRVAVS